MDTILLATRRIKGLNDLSRLEDLAVMDAVVSIKVVLKDSDQQSFGARFAKAIAEGELSKDKFDSFVRCEAATDKLLMDMNDMISEIEEQDLPNLEESEACAEGLKIRIAIAAAWPQARGCSPGPAQTRKPQRYDFACARVHVQANVRVQAGCMH